MANTSKRTPVQPLRALEEELSRAKEKLEVSLKFDMAEFERDETKVRPTIKSLREIFEEYTRVSYSYCQSLIAKGCVAEADAGNSERREFRKEVHQTIEMVNKHKTAIDIETLSNVDLESVISSRKQLKVKADVDADVQEKSGEAEGRKLAQLQASDELEDEQEIKKINLLDDELKGVPCQRVEEKVASFITGSKASEEVSPPLPSNLNPTAKEVHFADGRQQIGSLQAAQYEYSTQSVNPAVSHVQYLSEQNYEKQDCSLGNHIFNKWSTAAPTQLDCKPRTSRIVGSDPRPNPYAACSQADDGKSMHRGSSLYTGDSGQFRPDPAVQHLVRQDLLKQFAAPFQGESHRYFAWVNSIKNRIRGADLDPLDIIDILLANTRGKPHELVKDYISFGCQNPAVALETILATLHKEYGASVKVANELLGKLQAFPNITMRQVDKLAEFVRLCKITLSNISHCPELYLLNVPIGCRIVVGKLPETLRHRWRSTGHSYERTHGCHPPFSEFVRFLEDCADELSNPNYEMCNTQTFPKVAKQSVVLATASQMPTVKESVNSQLCVLHSSANHKLVDCKQFLQFDLSKRRAVIKEHKLCYKCLSPNHFASRCKVKVTCNTCKKGHITILHDSDYSRKANRKEQSPAKVTNIEKSTPVQNTTLCSLVCGVSNNSKNCSKTMLVQLCSKTNPNTTLKCYVIVDEQSNVSLADPKVANTFGFHSNTQEYFLTTMTGFKNKSKGIVITGLRVRGIGNHKWYDLPQLITNPHIPCTKREVATPSDVAGHTHLSHLSSYFQELDDSAEVLLLLGRDCGDLMRTKCYGRRAPFAHETPLGWALVGSTGPQQLDKRESTNQEHYTLKTCFTPCFDVFQERHDDELSDQSREDKQFLSIMESSITVNKEGNLVMPLPFKKNPPLLPKNRVPVYCRTRNTLHRLKQDPEKLNECIQAMQGYIDAGHMAELTTEQVEQVEAPYYIPVFPVVHPKKKKTRLVFDSSAQYGGTSLNQELLQGPDQNNRLHGVLQRFRLKPIAFVGDIEKMFHCFHLTPADRDYLRFYWFSGNQPSGGLTEYRANVHIFGNRPSPAIANYGLRYAAKNSTAAVTKEARLFLEHNVYVDDALGCAQTPEEAIDTLQGACNILKQYNIRLHKIHSNSKEVLRAFPTSERSEDVRVIDLDDVPIQRTLGVAWDVNSDEFVLMVNIPDKPFSKRGILSTVNSLFDPIGFAAPITLAGRLLQRKFLPPKTTANKDFHLDTYGWDDLLPDKFLPMWENWKESLTQAHKLKLPRSITSISFGSAIYRKLHVFSDASKDAIGYVIFVQSDNGDNESQITFACAGSKVAPRCATSIPRLELCAAVEAVKAAEELLLELFLTHHDTSFYTDSEVVLSYLSNTERRFTRYVTRRVEIIHATFPDSNWSYVPTDQNPADVASRPHSPEALLQYGWLKSPAFLYDKVNFPMPCMGDENLPEVVSEATVLHAAAETESAISSLMRRINNFSRLKKILYLIMTSTASWIDKSRQRLGQQLAPRSKQVISIDEATTVLAKCAQREAYPEIYQGDTLKLPHTHKLCSLSAFLDLKGVLRVGGRIRNANVSYDTKHPILVPYNSPLSYIVLLSCHSSVRHQGRHLTQGAVQAAGFFLEKGSKVIRKFLNNCITCKKLRAPLLHQKMADLPADRLEETPPFTNCGMDVFGPFHIIDGVTTRRSNATKKVWGVLFTCLTSRAVHIETLPSLDTSSFINALRRFYAIRGKCKVLRSDRGTNFMGARNIKESSLSFSAIESEIMSMDCVWQINPPHSSHFGGCWERKIGSVRRIMDATYRQLGKRTLSRDEFTTLMAEAAAIINNTPLWATSQSPDDLCPITPAMLLTLRGTTTSQAETSTTTADVSAYGKRRWRRVQHLANEFWVRYRNEYLQSLQVRRKWTKEKQSLEPGDIVIIKDKSSKRNVWPMGKVISVNYSKDNLVRSVSIKTMSRETGKVSNFERPIVDVVLLMKRNDATQ